MKIYIENITPQKLNKKSSTLLEIDKFLISRRDYFDIYSEEGIYNVSLTRMEKVKEFSEYKPVKIVSPFSAIIDRTIIIKEDVYTLPIYHYADRLVQFNYSIHKKSNLNLVIKGSYKNNLKQDILSLMNNGNLTDVNELQETYETFEISDVYFTIIPQIQPLELQQYMEEFNEFFISLK